MSGARYWERIDEAAPRPTYVSMALPTFPNKDLWGGPKSKKTRFAYFFFLLSAPTVTRFQLVESAQLR